MAFTLSPLCLGCHSKPSAPAPGVPVASPRSVALPESNTAADAPNSPAVAEVAAGSLTVYSDPATGVTFRYPSTWRPWHAGSTMNQPAIAENAGPVKITQLFDPAGTPLQKTNLVGVQFSYAKHAGTGAKSCQQFVASSVPGGQKVASKAISGVRFEAVKGGDAGMCHQRSMTVSSAMKGGACYLFEQDFDTLCPEVRGPGDPVALSPGQTKTLNDQLEQVLQSVSLR